MFRLVPISPVQDLEEERPSPDDEVEPSEADSAPGYQADAFSDLEGKAEKKDPGMERHLEKLASRPAVTWLREWRHIEMQGS